MALRVSSKVVLKDQYIVPVPFLRFDDPQVLFYQKIRGFKITAGIGKRVMLVGAWQIKG